MAGQGGIAPHVIPKENQIRGNFRFFDIKLRNQCRLSFGGPPTALELQSSPLTLTSLTFF
jgi:hypothetical protein